MTNLIGQKLGRYQITDHLGEGGMAVVYRAHDDHLEREVAIKVIRREALYSADPDQLLGRFSREARALARLTHPNIVGVIDYGEYNDAPYLVMEYLPGGSLREWMQARIESRQPFTYAEAARIVAQIARALDFAHAQGIFHRDVKPSNILLTSSGEPMLTDFGIAKLLEGKSPDTMHLTSTGTGIGTPEYMAPEQWVGKAVPLSDEYALGVVFYELVTGRKPYEADTPAELIIKQATEPLPPPRKFAPHLTVATESIILRALAKRPEERFPSLGAFASAIESSIAFQPEGRQRREIPAAMAAPPQATPSPIPGAKQPEPDPTLTPPGEQRQPAGGQTIVLPESIKASEEQAGIAPGKDTGPGKGAVPGEPRQPARLRWPWLAGALALLVVLGAAYWQFFLVPASAERSSLVLAAARETIAAKTAAVDMAAPATEPAQEKPTATILITPTGVPINADNASEFTNARKIGLSSILSASAYGFSEDGTLMAVSGGEKTDVYVTETLEKLFTIQADAEALAFSPDNKLLAVAVGSGIQVWDITGDQPVAKVFYLETSFGYLGVAFSPDLRYLAAYDKVGVFLFNLEQEGTREAMLTRGTQITDTAFSPDGTRFAITRLASVTDDQGSIQIFEVGQWDKPLRESTNDNGCSSYSVAFSPDSQRMAVGRCDHIATWSMANLLPLDHSIQTEAVYNLAYSSDGSVLVANSKPLERIMFLYNTKTLQEIASFNNTIFLALMRGGEKIATYNMGFLSLIER